MKKVIVIFVLCISLIAAVGYGSVVAAPSISLDDVDVKFSSAEFLPVNPFVTSYGAMKYFSDVSGVDLSIISDGYTFYQLNNYKVVIARSNYSDIFGYLFWKDGSGAYQYLMYLTEVPSEVTL